MIEGLLDRVDASPYLIVIDYTGLSVQQFTELRNRLNAGGARCTVAKNCYMRKVLAEAGLQDIGADLDGQMAYVMGDGEVFAAAKAIKNFEKEFKNPEMKIGIFERGDDSGVAGILDYEILTKRDLMLRIIHLIASHYAEIEVDKIASEVRESIEKLVNEWSLIGERVNLLKKKVESL